jgi:hypothetical protein
MPCGKASWGFRNASRTAPRYCSGGVHGRQRQRRPCPSPIIRPITSLSFSALARTLPMYGNVTRRRPWDFLTREILLDHRISSCAVTAAVGTAVSLRITSFCRDIKRAKAQDLQCSGHLLSLVFSTTGSGCNLAAAITKSWKLWRPVRSDSSRRAIRQLHATGRSKHSPNLDQCVLLPQDRQIHPLPRSMRGIYGTTASRADREPQEYL